MRFRCPFVQIQSNTKRQEKSENNSFRRRMLSIANVFHYGDVQCDLHSDPSTTTIPQEPESERPYDLTCTNACPKNVKYFLTWHCQACVNSGCSSFFLTTSCQTPVQVFVWPNNAPDFSGSKPGHCHQPPSRFRGVSVS